MSMAVKHPKLCLNTFLTAEKQPNEDPIAKKENKEYLLFETVIIFGGLF